MLESIRLYVQSRNINFDTEFNENNQEIRCTPHYKYNRAERIGNALFTPLAKVINKYDETNSRCTKAAMVVVGVVAAVIALVAYAFKRIGESVNPNSVLRKGAIEKCRDIGRLYVLVTGSSTPMMALAMMTLKGVAGSLEGMNIDQMFVEKILKEKKGASDNELGKLGGRGLIGMVVALVSSDPINPSDIHFAEIKKVWDEWYAAWKQIQVKIAANNTDITAEEATIRQLTADDEATQKKTMAFLDKKKTDVRNKANLIQAMDQYNTIVRAMW